MVDPTSEDKGRQESAPAPNAEELFHLLTENVTDYAIFTPDINGNIATWNVGAKRILVGIGGKFRPL